MNAEQDARFYAEKLLEHVDSAVYDDSGPFVAQSAPTRPLVISVLAAYGKERAGFWVGDGDDESRPSARTEECAEHLRAFVRAIAEQSYLAGRAAERSEVVS